MAPPARTATISCFVAEWPTPSGSPSSAPGALLSSETLPTREAVLARSEVARSVWSREGWVEENGMPLSEELAEIARTAAARLYLSPTCDTRRRSPSPKRSCGDEFEQMLATAARGRGVGPVDLERQQRDVEAIEEALTDEQQNLVDDLVESSHGTSGCSRKRRCTSGWRSASDWPNWAAVRERRGDVRRPA